MRDFSVADLLAWEDFPDFFCEQDLIELWAGRERITAVEILQLPIEPEVKLFFVLREEVLDEIEQLNIMNRFISDYSARFIDTAVFRAATENVISIEDVCDYLLEHTEIMSYSFHVSIILEVLAQ